MIRKLFVFTIVSLFVCTATAAFGQDSVERRIGRITLSQPLVGSYLGVQTKEITKENFAKYGLREVRGVAVEKVTKDSPAAQAGIQANDVIVSFGGEKVSSVYKLTRLLNETAPDHSAKITVVRGGSEIELTATLGKRELPSFENTGTLDRLYGLPGIPEYPNRPALPIPPTGNDGLFSVYRGAASRQIGVNATPLTKQLGDYFGVASGEGLLISTVRENSPAAKAGLKAGDIITEADGKALKNTPDLIRALGEKKEGDVTLTIVRDKNRRTVKVTPETSKETPMPFQYFGNSGEDNQRQLRLLRELNMQAPVQK